MEISGQIIKTILGELKTDVVLSFFSSNCFFWGWKGLWRISIGFCRFHEVLLHCLLEPTHSFAWVDEKHHWDPLGLWAANLPQTNLGLGRMYVTLLSNWAIMLHLQIPKCGWLQWLLQNVVQRLQRSQRSWWSEGLLLGIRPFCRLPEILTPGPEKHEPFLQLMCDLYSPHFFEFLPQDGSQPFQLWSTFHPIRSSPLVNIRQTMEHHHFLWVNQLNPAIFSRFLYVYQRVTSSPHQDLVKLFQHEGKVLRFKAKFAKPKPEVSGPRDGGISGGFGREKHGGFTKRNGISPHLRNWGDQNWLHVGWNTCWVCDEYFLMNPVPPI